MATNTRIISCVVFFIFVIGLCALFVVATGVKFVLNSSPFSETDSSSWTSAEAHDRGTWICDVDLAPSRFFWKGEPIAIKEAWIEAVAVLDHVGVWIPIYRRVGGYYLCFTLAEGEALFRGYPNPMFVLGNRHESIGRGTSAKEIIFYQRVDEYEDLANQRISISESFKELEGTIAITLRK
jgi:hypothetical protein